MRLIMIRHGEPNYELDCLTPRGRLQAEAVAERLMGEGISVIYASPMGRAQETAAPAARCLGLPVETLEFMHEITWGGEGIPERGHPWTLGSRMIAEEGYDFYGKNWQEHPYFRGNRAVDEYRRVTGCFDAVMRRHGFAQEGPRFFCTAEREETVALFSHGGSGGSVISGLLSLPFPYVCSVMPYDFTSVIVLNFPVQPGTYVFPRLELFNDCAHIRGITDGLRIQADTDEAVRRR